MKRIILLIFIGCCILSSHLLAQTNQYKTGTWPKSFLWRISGNGLTKTSYLYGTMHVQDKRLFYFTDSLYHYLSQAEGYSTEVDVKEFMDSVIKKIIEQRVEEKDDEKKKLSKSEEKKMLDSLFKNIKNYKDSKSKRQLEKLRREKVARAMKNKEMPTIMDAYLYGIARKKGKWLGGIEDIQDQLSLFDELGNDLSDEDMMDSDKDVALTLETMIDIYLAKNLNGVESFMKGKLPKEQEDMMFLKRNIKMARRMDSLANIRSMFFAVGAGHLPGDSGVINLLLLRGYRIEPVFSSTSVDPFVYASGLTDIPWIKVEDERKTYSVEMPGEPVDVNMYEDLIKMKLYMDITTFGCFFSGSVASTGKVNFDKMAEAITEDSEARVISKKMIEQDGMKGMEVIFTSGSYYFRAKYLAYDNMLYILMAGGEKKESIESADAKKFMQSFAVNKNRVAPVPTKWVPFEIKEKAVAVKLPGKPTRNTKLEKTAEGTAWTFAVYSYSDKEAGTYYMLQVRDIQPGYYITDDTAYFFQLKEKMKETIVKVTKDKLFKVGHFPAYSYEGESADGSIVFKTLIINRGSRSYTLYAGGANQEKVLAEMDSFLGSVSFSEYEKAEWKNQGSAEGGFYTAAPGPIKIQIDEKDEEEAAVAEKAEPYFLSYDPIDCISYHVYKEQFGPYFWISDDSTFHEKSLANYKTWNDSILSKKPISNGNLKGTEWIIETPGNTNLKKIRQFFNGDTLYTLIGFIPVWSIDDKEKKRFFNEFRVINEKTTNSAYQSKAAKLLTDLASRDSATYAEASSAVYSVSFTKKDLPLLQETLLNKFGDDSTYYYYSTRYKIISLVSELADSATIRFIKDNFATLSGDKEDLKFDLLEVLARERTTYSYSVLKDLLLTHTPKKMRDIGLSGWVDDSLQLTRLLFPEILQLSNNTILAEDIIGMSVALLDSNLISLDMLMPYRRNFMYTADTIFKTLQNKSIDDYYGGTYASVVSLLQYFNDAESNRLLQQYLTLDELTLKQDAVMALLKNKQTVDKKETNKIAIDREYRKDFYDVLKEAGKLEYFPSKYLAQQYMAESFLHNQGTDDYTPKEVKYIEAKTVIYKGEKKRFYLFKIVYDYEEENSELSEFLAMAGPFSTNTKDLKSSYEATTIFFDDPYDAKKINEVFEKYLKELQE